MVNWKSADSTDRLVASLVAAHPSLRVRCPNPPPSPTNPPRPNQIDYHAMSLVYGQGATYDAIEGRFRCYRKMADDLRAEAQARGVSMNQAGSAPRTPRGPRSRPTPSSSAKGKGTGKAQRGVRDGEGDGGDAFPETPSKKPRLDATSPGLSALTAIALDDSESDIYKGKGEEYVKFGVNVPVTPAKSCLARSGSPEGTPTPVLRRIKREDLAVGSVTPMKRSIEMSPVEQPKAGGIVQNMGVGLSLEVDTDGDGDMA